MWGNIMKTNLTRRTLVKGGVALATSAEYFLQVEDDAFTALMHAFTEATGVKVTISRESIDDVQPTSVAAKLGPARTCSGASIRCLTCSRRSAST
jgi:hypothetical protein